MLHVIVTLTVLPLVGVWLPPENSPIPSSVPVVPLTALFEHMKAPNRLAWALIVNEATELELLTLPLAGAPFGVHAGLFAFE